MRWPVRISGGTGGGGGGGGGADKFAPRIIVGNVLAGDPADAQAAPFEYIPDPGDGSGIAQALSTISGGGEIYVRPGTYDFSLGSIAGPLAIPAGVQLRGAGIGATLIITAQVGDRAAFALQSLASLSDMSVSSSADGTDTSTSDALVTTIGRVNIARVGLTVNVPAEGSLDCALLCSANPLSFTAAVAYLEDVTCAVFGGDKSKTLYISEGCEVQARGLTCQGGVTGVLIEAFGQGAARSFLEAIQFKLYDFSETGVSYEGTGGGISLYNGVIQPVFDAAAPVGVLLDGVGRFQLDHVELTGLQQTDSVAISVPSTQTEMSDIHIDRCTINGWYTGVFFGALGESQPVVDSWVRDCLIEECVFAGIIFGSSVTRCIARGNRIAMTEDNVLTAGCIAAVGGACEIEGNDLQIVQLNVASTATCLSVDGGNNRVINNRISAIVERGMQIDGADNTVTGNRVQVGGSGLGYGPAVRIASSAQRTAFTGNSIDASDLDIGQYALEAQANLVAIGTNVIRPQGGELAVSLSGNNCTVVGNTFPGSVGTGVNDTGAGNEIAHNVAA